MDKETQEILNQLNLANSAFDHYEAKIMKLKNLLEITKIINSTLEEDKLAQIILYSCQGQFLVQNATLLLLEDVDRGLYRDRLSIGLEKDRFGIEFDKKSTLLRAFTTPSENNKKSLTSKKAYFYKDIEFIFENNPEEKKIIETFNPVILAPLWGKNSLYGFLLLGNKLDGTSFVSEELGYIFQFSELAAVSIENAKLFEMAIMDRMTRLYNHQYFKNRLYEEMERVKRYKHPLSLMFFDIDHFKSFNDTYGHQQGDIVLKENAKIFKETVRKTDIPARYGGEEFAVILPETPIEEAYKVGEKIRQKVEAHLFPGQKDPLHVTISCGIAEINANTDENITPTDFIEMADQALYYSKRNGRNRVTLYSEEVKESAKNKEKKTLK